MKENDENNSSDGSSTAVVSEATEKALLQQNAAIIVMDSSLPGISDHIRDHTYDPDMVNKQSPGSDIDTNNAAAPESFNVSVVNTVASSSHSESRKETWRRIGIVALYFVTVAVLFADMNILAPNLSTIADEFGMDDDERDIKLGGLIALLASSLLGLLYHLLLVGLPTP